jgi:hypothetical protein
VRVIGRVQGVDYVLAYVFFGTTSQGSRRSGGEVIHEGSKRVFERKYVRALLRVMGIKLNYDCMGPIVFRVRIDACSV